MRIVVRLPNWLGDLVMSTAFMRMLGQTYPGATIEVVVKAGIDPILDYLPGITKKWIFNKSAYPGLAGAWKFGKQIAAAGKPDVFICLPDSFSSAVMCRATGAKTSIGYSAELRNFLLTNTIARNKTLHRADQYLLLLYVLTGKKENSPAVFLNNNNTPVANRIIVNVNSEAESRRLPPSKAVSILNTLRAATSAEIILVGSNKELPHVTTVYDALTNKSRVVNMAGKTDLKGLVDLLGAAAVMLTTDSGPMHVANALGVHTVALFGAGDERITAPYNLKNRTVLRNGTLPCEPCVKNVCKFGKPACLLQMDETLIVQEVIQALHKQ